MKKVIGILTILLSITCLNANLIELIETAHACPVCGGETVGGTCSGGCGSY